MISEELYINTTTRKITNTEMLIVFFQKIFTPVVHYVPGTKTPQTQLSRYISELEKGLSVVQNDPLSFWSQRSFVFCKVVEWQH